MGEPSLLVVYWVCYPHCYLRFGGWGDQKTMHKTQKWVLLLVFVYGF